MAPPVALLSRPSRGPLTGCHCQAGWLVGQWAARKHVCVHMAHMACASLSDAALDRGTMSFFLSVTSTRSSVTRSHWYRATAHDSLDRPGRGGVFQRGGAEEGGEKQQQQVTRDQSAGAVGLPGAHVCVPELGCSTHNTPDWGTQHASQSHTATQTITWQGLWCFASPE